VYANTFIIVSDLNCDPSALTIMQFQKRVKDIKRPQKYLGPELELKVAPST
jgi:hypothetical protein